MTDENGNICQHYGYSPFGRDVHKEDDTSLPLSSFTRNKFNVSNRFTGQILDEETGLYYYGARYYDPLLARFIQSDTVIPDPGSSQALNRYSYCYNNPLMFSNPSGNAAITTGGIFEQPPQYYSCSPINIISFSPSLPDASNYSPVINVASALSFVLTNSSYSASAVDCCGLFEEDNSEYSITGISISLRDGIDKIDFTSESTSGVMYFNLRSKDYFFDYIREHGNSWQRDISSDSDGISYQFGRTISAISELPSKTVNYLKTDNPNPTLQELDSANEGMAQVLSRTAVAPSINVSGGYFYGTSYTMEFLFSVNGLDVFTAPGDSLTAPGCGANVNLGVVYNYSHANPKAYEDDFISSSVSLPTQVPFNVTGFGWNEDSPFGWSFGLGTRGGSNFDVTHSYYEHRYRWDY